MLRFVVCEKKITRIGARTEDHHKILSFCLTCGSRSPRQSPAGNPCHCRPAMRGEERPTGGDHADGHLGPGHLGPGHRVSSIKQGNIIYNWIWAHISSRWTEDRLLSNGGDRPRVRKEERLCDPGPTCGWAVLSANVDYIPHATPLSDQLHVDTRLVAGVCHCANNRGPGSTPGVAGRQALDTGSHLVGKHGLYHIEITYSRKIKAVSRPVWFAVDHNWVRRQFSIAYDRKRRLAACRDRKLIQ